MSELFEFFVFLNVNEELGQSVKNQFSFINEDIDFILQELFADFFKIVRHGCAEHHDLFVVRSFNKYFLDVGSHAWISHDFIAFVNHKEFDFFKVNDFVLGKV